MSDETPSQEITVQDQKSDVTSIKTDVDMHIAPPSAQRGGAFRFAVLLVRGSLQFVLMAAILVGASFLMMQLAESRKERPKRAQKEAVYTVDTIVAKKADHQPMISVFGDIVAGRTLNLTALVAGEVISVNPALRIGAEMKAGDTLLTINPWSYELGVGEANANLKEAQAQLAEAQARLEQQKNTENRNRELMELAKADLERARTLLSRSTVTQRAVEERELAFIQRQEALQTTTSNIAIQAAQIEAREATIARLEGALRNAEKQLKDTVLKAPFAAVVQNVGVEIGQTVNNNAALMTLYEANTLDARFVLSDGQYGRLLNGSQSLEGKEVTVIWRIGGQDTALKATIDRVGAEIAADRGGVTVFARLDPTQRRLAIRPGAFVSVNVPDAIYEETFRVPETALFEGNLVYVVDAENRLEGRLVEVHIYDDGDVLVSGKLDEGDRIITTQLAEVGEGVLVRKAGKKATAKTAEAKPKTETK